MATKTLALPQTKGNFEIQGIITGVLKDSFYKKTKTQTGKDFRAINFGVKVDPETVLYLSLTGMPQEKVYFSGKDEKDIKDKNKKNETVPVEWSKRNSFSRKGFRLIGVGLGLEKTLDEKGKEVNSKKTLVPFDACDYIAQHLKDGVSVYIRGNIEYSHYSNQSGETVNMVKLVPQQISLLGSDIDFTTSDFQRKAIWSQKVVINDLNKEDERFILEALIVNYSTIEKGTFVIAKENSSLATNLKKKVGPYKAINIYGNINSVRNAEDVKEDSDSGDGWGTADPTKRVSTPYRREFLITGADPTTIDAETYTEKIMVEAMEEIKKSDKEKEGFNNQGVGVKNNQSNKNDENWGSTKKVVLKDSDSDEDEDTPWDN